MKIVPAPGNLAKDQYIDHQARENLYVIPYVSGRLVFAELAARAVFNGGFDAVAVDLPYFMNSGGYASISAGLLPIVTSLVVRNETSGFVTIPFVPSDAASAAVAAVESLKGGGAPPGLHFVDDSNMINYHTQLSYPDARLRDDYYVFTDGLTEYFSAPLDELKARRERTPGSADFFAGYRAAQVAEHLERVLKGGKRTLFVCEYRLWERVAMVLAGRERACDSKYYTPWTDLSAAIVFEDPYRCWAMGYLDDYPAVVERFYRLLRSGRIGSFDKIRELNGLLTTGLSNDAKRPSARKLIAFNVYLRARLCSELRLTPLPVTHLLDAARACLGRKAAERLAGELIRYPAAGKKEIHDFLKIHRDSISISNITMEIPDISERTPYLRGNESCTVYDLFDRKLRALDITHPYLSKSEMEELESGHSGSVAWEHDPEFKLHQVASGIARDTASRKERTTEVRVRRSWGSMGAGVHMKSTIASMANGEDAIYIKERKTPKERCVKMDEYTPTVFLFSDDLSGHNYTVEHDANETQRKIYMNREDLIRPGDPAADYVYSVYVTHRHADRICDGHIRRYLLTSLVILCNKHFRADRHAHITKRPARFQCRTSPERDPELYRFSDNELGTAWAIKYAESSVLVVAREGWKPTPGLKGYARARGVKIVTVPLSSLSEEFLERMRLFHNISTPLMKHSNRDGIMSRFVR